MHIRNTFAAGAALGALLLSASVVPTAAAARPLSDRMVSALSFTAQSEVQNADGSVTDAWTVDGIPVSVTGPSRMVVTADVTIVKGQHRLLVGATPPTPSKTWSRARTAASSYPYPFRSWCVNITPSKGYAHSCDYQQFLYKNGGDWYVSDGLTMSAHYGNGFFDPSLRFMYVYSAWTAGNVVVQWSPISSDIPIGNCQTATVGIAYYASAQESWTVCPAKYGLFTASNTQFGVYWSGQSQSWQGVDGLDAVHSPPGVPATTTLYTNMYWW